MEENNEHDCPNGCGELDTTSGNIDTNSGRSYFEIVVLYCEECGYVAYEPVLESGGSENGWLIAMDDPYLNEDSIWTIPTDFIR